jgi:hypothetical protein
MIVVCVCAVCGGGERTDCVFLFAAFLPFLCVDLFVRRGLLWLLCLCRTAPCSLIWRAHRAFVVIFASTLKSRTKFYRPIFRANRVPTPFKLRPTR